MNFQKVLSVRLWAAGVLLAGAVSAAAQDKAVVPVTLSEKPRPARALAGQNNLYCAGYLQTGPVNTANQLIAGQHEADRYTYSQNDYLFVNMGADKGVKVGDVFGVIRPRGDLKNKWSKKKVGYYVQEVGAVEVVDVKAQVSVVRVKASCDNFLLGDLIEPMPVRTSPQSVDATAALNPFSNPTGGATGRIVLGRDNHVMLTRDQIAYVDLGADENVKVGDKMNIYRMIEKGNLFLNPDKEGTTSRDYGFESDNYGGGNYSNQSARKKGEKADGSEIRTAQVRKNRPSGLRKTVGEAVVLNVKERSATIVITRTTQEIHTGDWVEIK